MLGSQWSGCTMGKGNWVLGQLLSNPGCSGLTPRAFKVPTTQVRWQDVGDTIKS